GNVIITEIFGDIPVRIQDFRSKGGEPPVANAIKLRAYKPPFFLDLMAHPTVFCKNSFPRLHRNPFWIESSQSLFYQMLSFLIDRRYIGSKGLIFVFLGSRDVVQ